MVRPGSGHIYFCPAFWDHHGSMDCLLAGGIVVSAESFQTMVTVLYQVFYRPIIIGLTIFSALAILLSVVLFVFMLIRPRVVEI
jgi:hypothetical protein